MKMRLPSRLHHLLFAAALVSWLGAATDGDSIGSRITSQEAGGVVDEQHHNTVDEHPQDWQDDVPSHPAKLLEEEDDEPSPPVTARLIQDFSFPGADPTPAPAPAGKSRRRRRSQPRPTEPPPVLEPIKVPGCKGKLDIMVVLDASKSVKKTGFKYEAGFAAKFIEVVMKNGNPNGHRVNVHYFNKGTTPVVTSTKNLSGPRNSLGKFTTKGLPFAKALRSLNYLRIRQGATDHPQVFETAAKAFNKYGRKGTEKLLVLITDGATHNGKCKKSAFPSAAVDKKIGRCSGNGNHACAAPTGKDPACATQCLCGLYKAQLYKDRGYKVILVGIANQHHIGQTQAGRFNTIMKAMASDGEAYLAREFKDLTKLIKPFLKSVCR